MSKKKNHGDEYDGIFDTVSVEDFERDTSAVLQSYTAPPTFDEFIQRHLGATRIAFAASDGRINPVAWLTQVGQPEVVERVYVPDDDETLGQFIARLGREARTHQANALFYVMKTSANITWHQPGAVDFANETLEGKIDEDTAFEVVMWYAEHLGERKSGMIHIEDKTRMGEEVVSGGPQRSPIFETVLSYLQSE